jgi:hypothetical protein
MACYDRYPIRVVMISMAQLLAAAAIGFIVMARLDWWAAAIYALIGGLGAVLSLAWSCTRCRYYGKICGLGLGKLAALGFHKRSVDGFGRDLTQRVAWTVDALVLALPASVGLATVFTRRTWPDLVVLLIFLGLVAGIALTHSKLVCRRCVMAREGRCTLGGVSRSS